MLVERNGSFLPASQREAGWMTLRPGLAPGKEIHLRGSSPKLGPRSIYNCFNRENCFRISEQALLDQSLSDRNICGAKNMRYLSCAQT